MLQLARLLRLKPMRLTVITNGLALAQELVGVPEVDVITIGGPYAEAVLMEFSCDQLFRGTTAINRDGVMQTLDAAEAAINRRMLERAEERVMLVDSSKLGHRASYRVAGLERVNSVITDSGLNPESVGLLEKCDIGLERAKLAS